MSLNAEQQNDTELDHIRDTLTGIVSFASKTRGEMHQRFDQQDKRFDQQDKRFDQQDKRFDQQDKRFDHQDREIASLKADNAEIKEMLKTLLSR
ncbi:hypothetical protein [Endozoicomonas euniceicola]|uniref:t-SNARE coiled-coil homology domain-containing protein n=1 Tax=Endozoicomonas euniceicola TaxID=1234143 RepID=A0ABY6GRC8_9GAMM|nr:hypothetical protein [Endozoicomonas euniceicola]UYM14696.1 hypothetical protein NX720_17620 [Endozoicomonas euniceicola]